MFESIVADITLSSPFILIHVIYIRGFKKVLQYSKMNCEVIYLPLRSRSMNKLMTLRLRRAIETLRPLTSLRTRTQRSNVN